MNDADRSDEGLRAAYRAGLPPTPEDRGDCPSPEVLERLSAGESSDDERLPLLDHVMACPGCLPEFELLRAIREASAMDVGDAAPTAPEAVVRLPGHPDHGGSSDGASGEIASVRRARPRWSPPLAIAAGIAVLISSAVILRFSPDDPVLRGGTGPGELVSPAGSVERPEALVWRSGGAQATYRVEVLGADGALLFEAATSDTVLPLPATLGLSQGSTYRWIVETVTLEEGARRAGPLEFRIR